MALFRKIRAILGNAVVWSGAWATAGVVVRIGLEVLNPTGRLLQTLTPFIIDSAALGFVTGIFFSGAILAFCRNRPLRELEPLRFAALGAGVGLLVPLAFLVLPPVVIGASVPLPLLLVGSAVLAGLGASVSAGSLMVARGAPGLANPTGAHARSLGRPAAPRV